MGELRTRRLGRTGLEVTELGLGAMDTPTSDEGAATIHAAIDQGITFIDTAREYAGSEFLLGQVIRERGGKDVQIASKTFSHSINGSQYDVDRSIKTLGVESIDLYQLHDISTMEAWEAVQAEDGALEGLRVAQYRGLIQHIGLSSHSPEVLEHVIPSGLVETVMIDYSAFYTETAPLLDLAAEHDVGVITMRPLGGSGRTSVMRGRADEGDEGQLTPANLLRYVLSNPAVSVAIPGARYPERIDENVRTASSYSPMTGQEKRALETEAARLY